MEERNANSSNIFIAPRTLKSEEYKTEYWQRIAHFNI